MAWSTLIIIPKGDGTSRGTRLIETCWKIIFTIIFNIFTLAITFHEVLHGFRSGLGTNTEIMEVTLIQKYYIRDLQPLLWYLLT